jgi:ketosteroid isomerase-like protein
VQVVQRLDGALQSFIGGSLEDDVAILTLSPASGGSAAVDAGMVERLFQAFNRRDADEVAALCDDEMEFYAVTAQEVGRNEPYVGWDGLRTYLDDVARVWEELLITPRQVEEKDGVVLVRGRVYLRSRAMGIRDMPAGWVWEVRDGRFVRGEVYIDPEEAVRRFRRAAPTEPQLGPSGPRSMTRLR